MRGRFRETWEQHQDDSVPCQKSLEFGCELGGILRAQGSNIVERLPQLPLVKCSRRHFRRPQLRASYPRSQGIARSFPGPAALCLPFLTRLAAFASPRSFAEPLPPDRCLSFYNTHTGEAATVEYCRSGCLLPASLEKIDHILRDHRTGETRAIDVRLLDLLHALSRATATEEPYHIISGYRSPKTNDFLRARGGGEFPAEAGSAFLIPDFLQ